MVPKDLLKSSKQKLSSSDRVSNEIKDKVDKEAKNLGNKIDRKFDHFSWWPLLVYVVEYFE